MKKRSESSEGVGAERHLLNWMRRKGQLIHSVANSRMGGMNIKKDGDNNSHHDGGGKGSRVTAFPHPPAQGQ